MKKINKKQKSGFTLIELLVVATIIIVLSAIGMVSFINAGKSARNAKRQSDLETVRQALVLYKSDNGFYPPSLTGPATNTKYNVAITALVSGYISSPTPVDPKTGTSSCGVSSNSACDYTYTGDASTFTLTAPLEGVANFVLTQP